MSTSSKSVRIKKGKNTTGVSTKAVRQTKKDMKKTTKKNTKKETKQHIDETTALMRPDDYTMPSPTSAVETPWTIINSYFEEDHLTRMVRHQIESYNNFVNIQIERTIEMFNTVSVTSPQFYDEDSGKHSLELEISFHNFVIQQPHIYENNGAVKTLFPHEARLRMFTYASPMLVDLHIKIIRRKDDDLENVVVEHVILPEIHIGKLPVMLKSSICVLSHYPELSTAETHECKHDSGGYFIVSGSEKCVLAQERAAENRVYVFDTRKNSTKWSWTAEVKSVPHHKIISPKQITVMMARKNNGFGHAMYVQLPRMKNIVPLFVLFRALGIESDKDICDYILLDSMNDDNKKLLFMLRGSIVDSNDIKTQEEAFQIMMNNVNYTMPLGISKDEAKIRKREFTQNVLEQDMFPHCQTKQEKVLYLGYLVNQLLRTKAGMQEPSDRDSYLNKRVDLVGALLNNLFRNYFNKMVKDMQKQIVREMNQGSWRTNDDYRNILNQTNIYKIVKSSTIENGMKRALSTGDFGIKNVNSNKVGVAQVLNRLTYISSLSHLRRVNTPIDKSGKLVPPRRLHSSSWGFICPAETPEGASVGIVKNLGYMTHVTIPTDSLPMDEMIRENEYLDLFDNESVDVTSLYNKPKVIVNGCWIGTTRNPNELYKDLKKKKAMGIINIYASIVFDVYKKEVRVVTDCGRMTRPLLRVENNNVLMTADIVDKLSKKHIKWNDLLTSTGKVDDIACIEYVDAEEQDYAMIAMKRKDLLKDPTKNTFHLYTHCEIHPSTIFGVLASCIPFPDHNQAPRNTYQAAMGKQAMGMYLSNFDKRMDKTSYVLSSPMRPLVDTRIMNILKLNDIPSGEMVVVAIASYSGYNQEDSLIFNRGAIDRGLFASTIYHTEKDEDKKVQGDQEVRCKPDKTRTSGIKFANYEKLSENGFMPENTLVESKDIIMGKVVPIRENKNDHTKVIKYQDASRIYRTNEETFVDKNYVERNGDGYTFSKVRLRAYRKPVIGDKHSSRHGQKGTIGVILEEQDMPFTDQGIRPDIIINPHAIPSRMTIGQLKETVFGKVLLELGMFGDATSFNDFPVKDICKELQKVGYERHGNEILMNGMTGEQMESSIFIGPAFYQRLKHCVNDKQHSRSIGPMVVLTRQPAEGRARDGGLRCGEMERDCIASHGASRFLRERMYDVSDKYEAYVCRDCGNFAAFNNNKHVHYCKMCDNRTSFDRVEVPYACKLLFQELVSMNVAPRIITQ